MLNASAANFAQRAYFLLLLRAASAYYSKEAWVDFGDTLLDPNLKDDLSKFFLAGDPEADLPADMKHLGGARKVRILLDLLGANE